MIFLKKIFLAAFLIFIFTCSAYADDYDVTKPHVIINQILGGKNESCISHSFIELYNPTDNEVDLSNYAIHYRSSAAMADEDDAYYTNKYHDKWYKLDLDSTKTIPSRCSYLIICNADTTWPNTADETRKITNYDQEFSSETWGG